MEIEIPRRLAWYVLSVLLAITPLIIGILTSPYSEDKRPLLLTPRLARVNEYRQEARTWVKSLREVDAELKTLLDEQSDDLFDQNFQVNHVYQQTRQLEDAIDQRPIPPTFESFQELLGETAIGYMDAITLISQWISEPGEENRQAAVTALSTAYELLNRLYANPWIEVKP